MTKHVCDLQRLARVKVLSGTLRERPGFPADETDLSLPTDCARVPLGSQSRIDRRGLEPADSDILESVADPGMDRRDTFLSTFDVLHVTRARNASTPHFASSSAYHGDIGDRELHASIDPILFIFNED